MGNANQCFNSIVKGYSPTHEIKVKIGDVKNAGTNANIYCVVIDDALGRSKEIKLDCDWRDDFEKGSISKFEIATPQDFGSIERIEFWRDKTILADDWLFLEYIKIRKIHRHTEDYTTFPFNRWVSAGKRHLLFKYDSILPQLDERKYQRLEDLEILKKRYAFGAKNRKGPRRIASLPTEEHFSNEYKWDITATKLKLMTQSKLCNIFDDKEWKSMADLLDVYRCSFGVPKGYYNWDSDENFGEQRLIGCTPTLIRLLKEIPKNFAITDEMLKASLGGLTIEAAIRRKMLYYIDLTILEGVECKNDRYLAAPFALFCEDKDGLKPIAIQLQPGSDNPVFLPTDPEHTWMLAKMYYNNAECAYHQSCSHLGFTHLICESICVSVRQTLSPSHPVFRLLAPHFLYLIAINSLAVEKLLVPDGWIDAVMQTGVSGFMDILEKKWEDWRFDTDGWLPNDLRNRGVDDTSRLKKYLYRNDALLIHEEIVQYVTNVISYVYDNRRKLKEDYEIQNFGALLVDSENGPGIKGVFGNGKFENLDDLIKVISGTIFLCSAAHAATNFNQYDEYAFPANYPALLNGPPPTDKNEKTECDILNQLPDKDTTLSIMIVTKILSQRGTNGLGDFEVQYQYEPNALKEVKRFRKKIRDVSKTIKTRNNALKEPYTCLDPVEVPNSISI